MALVEVTKQGNVGIVTMNRPEALNALSSAVFADLTAALDQVEHDDDVYVVIITGAGRAFALGQCRIVNDCGAKCIFSRFRKILFEFAVFLPQII